MGFLIDACLGPLAFVKDAVKSGQGLVSNLKDGLGVKDSFAKALFGRTKSEQESIVEESTERIKGIVESFTDLSTAGKVGLFGFGSIGGGGILAGFKSIFGNGGNSGLGNWLKYGLIIIAVIILLMLLFKIIGAVKDRRFKKQMIESVKLSQSNSQMNEVNNFRRK